MLRAVVTSVAPTDANALSSRAKRNGAGIGNLSSLLVRIDRDTKKSNASNTLYCAREKKRINKKKSEESVI